MLTGVQLEKTSYQHVKVVVILTKHIDAVVNPIFYYFINKEIRDGVLDILS